ncbi:uncharacterized protein C11orf24 homolog [Orycteropus afer afer]|uniref:Uncharacterized protein C11orf24 homolog n=1 Tax=Orycteropus afer afer TaxID=1230840 RepID=A0A8B7A593_ORYAF|nr:uncharacterized protein C11orf24 homolog [Orycteropus afer afer]
MSSDGTHPAGSPLTPLPGRPGRARVRAAARSSSNSWRCFFAAGHVPALGRGPSPPSEGRRAAQACRAQICLIPEGSACSCPTCATKHAMAWGCPPELLSPPAKPDRTRCQAPSTPRGKMAQPGTRPEQLPLVGVRGPEARSLLSDPSAKQQGIMSGLRSQRQVATRTAQPHSRLAHKMWPVFVLVWVSCLAFSDCQAASNSSGHLVPNNTWSPSVRNGTSREMVTGLAGNKTPERTSVLIPSTVTLTTGTRAANPNSTEITAETVNRTEVAVTDLTASRTSAGPASSVPTSASRTLPTAASRHPSPSMPYAHMPGSSTVPGSGMVPGTAAATRAAPRAETVATTTPSAHSMPSPPRTTAGNSTAHLTPTSSQVPNTTAQGPTPQAPTDQPVVNTTTRTIPVLSDTTSTSTSIPSVASVSVTQAATTKAQAKEPTASPAPVPHASPAPTVVATSPTTQAQPDLTLSAQAATGWVGTEAIPSTIPAGSTLGSSADTKRPATDLHQLSTQGQDLVVTAGPPAPSLSFLLALLVLGVTLFITVLVLFALQAYESYKKKDYTQVDYLINGMYADSEM